MILRELINEHTYYYGAIFDKVPEFKAMKNVKQNHQYHKEFDVETHTKLTWLNMCDFFLKTVPEDNQRLYDLLPELPGREYDRLLLVSAALCHDIGKPVTTFYSEEDSNWHSKNHGKEGAKIVERLFAEEEPELLSHLSNLVKLHMKLNHAVMHETDEGVLKALTSVLECGTDIRYFIWLFAADLMGSISDNTVYDMILDYLKKLVRVLKLR